MSRGITHGWRFIRGAAAALASVAILAAGAAAQSLDNKGKDFILSFLRNESNGAVELHLTADVATQVTVEYPINAPTFTTTVNVGPGAVTIVGLPITAGQGWVANGVHNNSVRARADEEFVCYMIHRATATSDAAMALPIDALNTEYIIADYSPLTGAEFNVTAAFDGTTVTITPSKSIIGHAAGVPFNVALNRGQAYFAFSSITNGAAGSLSGTIVTSDRPVSVTNGDKCANVPIGSFACDHIFEVAQPVQSWGKRVLVTNLPNRNGGTIYRIYGSVNGTTVSRNGIPIGVVNRGTFLETGFLTGSHEFTATEPFYVVQFMTGQTSAGATLGDPAMSNMIPAEQYLTDYTFSTVGGGQFAQNFVTIIAAATDVGSLLLDGVTVPAASFTPIGATGFSSAIVALSSGSHTTSSADPHGITVEGYNSFDSYIYPGGALFRFINPVGDANPPECEFDYNDEQNAGSGTATDDRPSEDVDGDGILDPGEDLNGDGLVDVDTGIFFVQLAPGASNLTLVVDPFVPGDGSVSFSVSLTDGSMDGTGTIVVTDGAGNTCEIPVELISNRAPTIACDESVTAECASPDGTGVTLAATVDDEDGDSLTVTWTIGGDAVQTDEDVAAGSEVSFTGTFPDGTTTVTVTVDDGKADPVSCDVAVTVVDTTGPVVTMAAPATVWPPNHKYVTFGLQDCVEGIVDACEGSLDVESAAAIVSISSDEPEDAAGTGDGGTADDIVILDAVTFKVRAERAGGGNGRVYTVTFTVTDGEGNATTATCTIGVPHDSAGDDAVDDGASSGYTVTN